MSSCLATTSSLKSAITYHKQQLSRALDDEMSAAVDANVGSATQILLVTLDQCLDFYITNITPCTSLEAHKGKTLSANCECTLSKIAMKGGYIKSIGKSDMQTRAVNLILHRTKKGLIHYLPHHIFNGSASRHTALHQLRLRWGQKMRYCQQRIHLLPWHW
jgi:hypothetical protein